jgi:putative transposon-encoded protein
MPPRKKRPDPNPAQQPITLTMTGYEVVEKEAKPCATSARILVPHHWVGKRVRAVRLDR